MNWRREEGRDLLLRVELHLDAVGGAGGRVPDLALLHLVGQAEAAVPLLHLLLKLLQAVQEGWVGRQRWELENLTCLMVGHKEIV